MIQKIPCDEVPDYVTRGLHHYTVPFVTYILKRGD